MEMVVVKKQMLCLLFASCLLGLMSTVEAIHFEHCQEDTSIYEAKVERVRISPKPIDKTKPWTVEVTASYDHPVSDFSCEDKKVNALLSLAPIDFAEHTSELCEKLLLVEETERSTSFVFSYTQAPTSGDPLNLLLWVSKGEDERDVITCIRVEFDDQSKRVKEDGHIYLPNQS